MPTTTDWTKGSPTIISSRIKKSGTSPRKCRLFCVACCLQSRPLISNADCLDLLEVVEQWADNPELAEEVKRLRRVVGRWSKRIHPGAGSMPDWLARWSVHCAADSKIVPPVQGFLKQTQFRPLLREIMGDISAPHAFDGKWRSLAVTGMAQAIYQRKDFTAMSILADALEEAECSDPDILNHCREDTAHYRGCWVLDLILKK